MGAVASAERQFLERETNLWQASRLMEAMAPRGGEAVLPFTSKVVDQVSVMKGQGSYLDRSGDLNTTAFMKEEDYDVSLSDINEEVVEEEEQGRIHDDEEGEYSYESNN